MGLRPLRPRQEEDLVSILNRRPMPLSTAAKERRGSPDFVSICCPSRKRRGRISGGAANRSGISGRGTSPAEDFPSVSSTIRKESRAPSPTSPDKCKRAAMFPLPGASPGKPERGSLPKRIPDSLQSSPDFPCSLHRLPFRASRPGHRGRDPNSSPAPCRIRFRVDGLLQRTQMRRFRTGPPSFSGSAHRDE